MNECFLASWPVLDPWVCGLLCGGSIWRSSAFYKCPLTLCNIFFPQPDNFVLSKFYSSLEVYFFLCVDIILPLQMSLRKMLLWSGCSWEELYIQEPVRRPVTQRGLSTILNAFYFVYIGRVVSDLGMGIHAKRYYFQTSSLEVRTNKGQLSIHL